MITEISALIMLVCGGALWLGGKFATRDAALRRAIKADEIQAWYQPLYCGRTGGLAGCEVAPRWQRSGEGVMLPEDVFRHAEGPVSGALLMHRLMQRVVRDMSSVKDALPEGFHLALCIRAEHLDSSLLEEDCLYLQRETNCGVVLVLTRQRADEMTPARVLRLKVLRALGVRLALDDFGRGLSGLEDLARLPADYIRPSRRFTEGPGEPGSAVMMALITAAARQLSLSVVAGGVRSQEHREWLAGNGVTWFQGDVWSPPLPFGAFSLLVSRQGQADAGQKTPPAEHDVMNGGTGTA